jgi:hypothetical protein
LIPIGSLEKIERPALHAETAGPAKSVNPGSISDHDSLACEGHVIARRELLPLAGFDGPVHHHETFAYGLLGLSAAGRQSAKFQELTKLDGHFRYEHPARYARFVIGHEQSVASYAFSSILRCSTFRPRCIVPFLHPMLIESRKVRPGPGPRQVLNEYGVVETIPGNWDLLPPGDAALSRRIKQDGPSITVIAVKGRRRFSRGIWAPSSRIAALRGGLLAERQDPSYQKKLDASRRRRADDQEVYAGVFRNAVLGYLNFHSAFQPLAEALADSIATHAVPVGSGTVARTARIPIEERASAATIAWLRHQATPYEQMEISRAAGRRRQVRRMLAHRSTELLARYRAGRPVDPANCPLLAALKRVAARSGPGNAQAPREA